MDGWLGLPSQRKALEEERSADPTLKPLITDLGRTFLFWLFLGVGAAVANLAFGAASQLISFMMQRKPLFVTCALSVGIMMYKIKKEFPVPYGLFAIGFGVACVVRAIYTWPTNPINPQVADPHLASLIALGSGVYVIARGTEDFRKGSKKKEPKAGETA